jgi:hypothetical protein
LDEFTADNAEAKQDRSSIARGHDLLVQITGGVLPNAPFTSIILGLLARSAQFIKCASGTSFLVTLSASEVDGLRRQISGCWNLQGLNPNQMRGMVVRLNIVVRPDRSVQSVTTIDQARKRSDPFFGLVAERAEIAVKTCGQLNLPPDKYDLWKEMIMSFRPEDAIRG